MTVARRSRCETDSRCAVAPQHASPSGSRELEYAGPISLSTNYAQRLGQRSLSFHRRVHRCSRELLITQQAQYVGIPDDGVTQSKMASDNAALASRRRRASHFSNARPHFAPASCLFLDLLRKNPITAPASHGELKVSKKTYRFVLEAAFRLWIYIE